MNKITANDEMKILNDRKKIVEPTIIAECKWPHDKREQFIRIWYIPFTGMHQFPGK